MIGNERFIYKSGGKRQGQLYQTYYLPNARTNYGMFNIRFKGPKVWNDLDENIKGFSLSAFKNKLKQNFLESY